MLKRLKLWLIVGLLGAAAAVFTQTVHAAIDFTVVVDSTGNTGIYTSVALDADGIPVISYFNQSDNTLKLADCQTPACTEFETRTVPNTGSVTGYTSLELDASGHPVITYWRSGSLGLAVCDDLICAAPTVRVVDDAGIVGANNALELNSAGNPVIAYESSSVPYKVKLAICSDPTCASRTIRELASGPDPYSFIALALDAADNVVVSYYDTGLDELQVATCSDPACTTPTVTTVDSNGDVGLYTSVAVTPYGTPAISYYDRTGENLKLAVCGTPTCSQRSLYVVDGSGDVGRDTSLTLDATGAPVIAYADTTNNALKLATCDSLFCSNPTIRTLDAGSDNRRFMSIVLDEKGSPVISYHDDDGDNLNLYRAYTPIVPNSDFDAPLTAWSLIANGGGDRQICLFEGCGVLLRGSGGTELIRTVLPVETLPAANWTLTLALGGYELPAGGAIGARLEFLQGDVPVAQSDCLVTQRGTFDTTTITCAAATAPADYDALRISVGWQGLDTGLLFLDAVDLSVTN